MLAQPRRARRHFEQAGVSCQIAVAYGGDDAHHVSGGCLAPWHALEILDKAAQDIRPAVSAAGGPLTPR